MTLREILTKHRVIPIDGNLNDRGLITIRYTAALMQDLERVSDYLILKPITGSEIHLAPKSNRTVTIPVLIIATPNSHVWNVVREGVVYCQIRSKDNEKHLWILESGAGAVTIPADILIRVADWLRGK